MAGTRPEAKRLIATGAGMGTTLRVADQQAGYTLTDRATFLQLAPGLRCGSFQRAIRVS